MSSDLNLDIYVISLPDAHDRRERVQREFSSLGLHFQFFNGVDANSWREQLLSNTDVELWERNMGAKLTMGHLGCYMAHVDLWKKVSFLNKPVLICEDDVTFSKNFLEALENALGLQDAWDICRFSKIRAIGPITVQRLENFELNYYWGPFTGNACYLIHPLVAKKLSHSFLPITRAHDHELNRFFVHDIRLTGLEPFSASPVDHGLSYITGDGNDNVHKLHKLKRVPHYFLKLSNYVRRFIWLWMNGIITIRSK
jgi:glycosyl transferase family 25